MSRTRKGTRDISAERARALLNYDQDQGLLNWKVRLSNRIKVGDTAGTFHAHTGYVVISIDGVLFKAHRLAWLIVHGVWPVAQLDHINGDRADNRLANLREVTNSENQRNQRKAKRNTESGVLGVYRVQNRSGRWRAAIKTDGGQRHLGHFSTKEEAYAAYVDAKRTYHSTCTL